MGILGIIINQTKLKNINHQNTSLTCFWINDETFGLFLKASKLKKNFIKEGALFRPIPGFIPRRMWPENACTRPRILHPCKFCQVNYERVKTLKSVCRYKIKYQPGVNIQWIFRWIVTLFSCWILITLLNFDTFLSRNCTGRGVRNPRWIVTPGQNSTLNCDPGSKFHVELWPRARIPHWIVIRISCHNLTLNHDSGSQFNVEFRPGS